MEFCGKFVIREAVDGRLPNPQSLDLFPAVPVNAAEIEHRQIVVGIEREGPLIGLDGSRRLAKIAVGCAELKPTQGVRLDAFGLFAQDRQALFEPTEEVEGRPETVAIVTARQIVGPPKTALSFGPVRFILRPVPKAIPLERGFILVVDVLDLPVELVPKSRVGPANIVPLRSQVQGR